MLYKFHCPKCDQRISANHAVARKVVICPQCTGSFVAPEAPGATRPFLAGIAISLLIPLYLFAMWAEWGPYAWLATLVGDDSSFNASRTSGYFGVFVVCTLLPLFAALLDGGYSKRKAAFLALGIPAVLLLIHFGCTMYMVFGSHRIHTVGSLSEAAAEIGFIPKQLEIKRVTLASLDESSAVRIETHQRTRSRKEESPRKKVYVAFDRAVWPDERTPVLMIGSDWWLRATAEEPTLNVIIHKTPLPLLVRRAHPEWDSLFAIAVEAPFAVTTEWMTAAVAYGVVMLIAMFKLCKKALRRKSAA